MVGDDEALVEASPPSHSAERHPSRCHRHARLSEDVEPAAAGDARRRDHERLTSAHFSRAGRHPVDWRQPHAAGAVGLHHLHHRTMADDWSDGGIDRRRQPLRLAERIGQQHARAAGIAVGPPPGVDLRGDRFRILPAIDRQAEGGLGDEHIALHRLERVAGWVGLELVVARHHPGHAAVRQSHLRRAEHVPRGMERHLDAIDGERVPVPKAVDRCRVSHAAAEHEHAGGRAEIAAAAGAGMVGMGMRDDRAGHPPPGVDVEIALGAVEARISHSEQIGHARRLPDAGVDAASVAQRYACEPTAGKRYPPNPSGA